jgi:diadenosine tetraphosphate (Ap4A) HIT family hydrolase
MPDCIFCKIIKGEIPSYKVWENEDYLAILDANPNMKGVTLVMTKEHYPSNILEMSDEEYAEFSKAAKRVAGILEERLEGVGQVAIVMEGMGINHAHFKLYPLPGTEGDFEADVSEKKVYYEEYPGFVDTKLGPKADSEDLKALAEKLRK